MNRSAKNSLPQTLIQIHYHDQIGGIGRVMDLWARTFVRLSKSIIRRNIIICAHAGMRCVFGDEIGRETLSADIFDLPECGYRRFRLKRDLLTARDTIRTRLDQLLDSCMLPRPIVIVGHNLTLGKNLALTMAFADCVRNRLRLGDDVHFHSVVHDLAEEGRVEMLRQIRWAKNSGIPSFLTKYIYPQSANLSFVTFSRDCASALKHAGVSTRRMISPITPMTGGRGRHEPRRQTNAEINETLRRRLVALARNDGVPWRRNGIVAVYPVRAIGRKNILEAAVIVSIVNNHNLVVGGPGTTEADRHYYQKIRLLCRNLKLPVLFECDRIGNGVDQRVMASVIAAADYAVSTSVLEGFGFGLYDPWLMGKPVVGRRPLGLTPPSKMHLEHLYDQLLIPVAWVDLAEVEARYGTIAALLGSLSGVTKKEKSRKRQFRDTVIVDGMIDFGVVDPAQQELVVRRLALCRTDCSQVQIRRHGVIESLPAFGALLDDATIRQNALVVKKSFGAPVFESQLAEALSCRQPEPSKPVKTNPGSVAQFYASPERFRYLIGGM